MNDADHDTYAWLHLQDVRRTDRWSAWLGLALSAAIFCGVLFLFVRGM